MKLLEPLTPDSRAPFAGAHPLAKLAAAAVLMLALFLTVDPLTPALVLVAVVAAVPAMGIPAGALARRAAPLFVSAAGIAFFNALVTGSVETGLAVALRLIGVALAGVVAVASVDPTELCDALIQHLHAPRRFAIGALAAFRLMPLFADEWDTIALARRARGLGGGRDPLARLTGFYDLTRALLISALRRATRLAIAMDARGFADPGCRTLARPRPIGPRGWSLVAGAFAIALLATALSVAAGTWRFFLGR